jgi:hypothetical protein
MRYRQISKIFTKIQIVLVSLLFTFSILGTLNINTRADICTIPTSDATITNIVTITDPSHYPIIPVGCKGPLSPASFPGIVSRSYGLISSIALNLLFFSILFNGFFWIYSGIEGGQELAKAKKNLQRSVTGFALILGTYVIVNTVVSLFVKDSVASQLDIQNFFNTNITK